MFLSASFLFHVKQRLDPQYCLIEKLKYRITSFPVKFTSIAIFKELYQSTMKPLEFSG